MKTIIIVGSVVLAGTGDPCAWGGLEKDIPECRMTNLLPEHEHPCAKHGPTSQPMCLDWWKENRGP